MSLMSKSFVSRLLTFCGVSLWMAQMIRTMVPDHTSGLAAMAMNFHSSTSSAYLWLLGCLEKSLAYSSLKEISAYLPACSFPTRLSVLSRIVESRTHPARKIGTSAQSRMISLLESTEECSRFSRLGCKLQGKSNLSGLSFSWVKNTTGGKDETGGISPC